MKNKEPFLSGLLIGLVVALALFLLSSCMWRREAVMAGAAEWVTVDDGSVTWQWKDEGG